MVSKMSSLIRQNLSSAAIREVEVKTKIKDLIQGTAKRRLGKLTNIVPDWATQQFQKYARFEVILALLLSLSVDRQLKWDTNKATETVYY